MADPQVQYPQASPAPVPGPQPPDQYGAIEAQAPLTFQNPAGSGYVGLGPVIANFLRGMDTYSRAVPHKILAGALASPLGNVLTAGASGPARVSIMREAQAGNAEQARQDFLSQTPVGSLPFGDVATDTLTDPLLGMGPIAKLGEPARLGLGEIAGLGKIGGRELQSVPYQLPSGESGVTDIFSPEHYSMLMRTIQGTWGNIQSALGHAPGWFADLEAPGPFKLAANQKIRMQEADYRRFFDNIQQAINSQNLLQPGGNMTDFLSAFMKMKPEERAGAADAMALSTDAKDTLLHQTPNLLQAIADVQKGRGVTLKVGADLLTDMGVALPTGNKATTWPVIKQGLADIGINSRDDLLKAYISRYGTDNPMTQQAVQKLRNYDVDPLKFSGDKEMLLEQLLHQQQKATGHMPEIPINSFKSVGEKLLALNDIQKSQAVATSAYVVNNMLQRDMALAMFGHTPMDILQNNLAGFKAAIEFHSQQFKDLPHDMQRLALLPGDVRSTVMATKHFPTSMLDPGTMATTFDTSLVSADELLNRPPMAMAKAGPLYPILTAALGGTGNMLAGGGIPGLFVGLAEGGLAGKVAQQLAPAIKDVERISEYFGRTKVWHGEYARVLNQAMTQGLGDDEPFAVQVVKALADPNDKSIAHQTQVAGLLQQGLTPGFSGSGVPVPEAFGGDKSQALNVVLNRARQSGDIVSDALKTFWQENPEYKPFGAGRGARDIPPPVGAPAAARNAIDSEASQAIFQTLMRSNGIISSSDIGDVLRRYAGAIGNDRIAQLQTKWEDILNKADDAGWTKAAKVMNIPQTRNADEYLKYFFLFHYWATRNIPWWGEQVLSNPQYSALVLRQIAASEKEIAYRGLPTSLVGASAAVFPETALLGGLIHAFYGPGTMFWNLYNPFGSLGPAAEQRMGGGQWYDASADLLRMAANMSLKPNYTADWLLHLMGAYGPDEPSPDFFRYGPLLRSLPALGLPGTDMNMIPRAMMNVTRETLSPIIGPQTPGDLQDYEVRRRIRELAAAQGLNPASPQVRAMESNYGSPLYLEALRDVRKEQFIQGAMSTLSPLPGSTTFMRQPEMDIRAQIAQDMRTQGLRDDLKQMFSNPLSAVSPAINTYKGLSFTHPEMPQMADIIRGAPAGPQLYDPRTIAMQYMTWAQAHGIPANQMWNRQNVQSYYEQTEFARRIGQLLGTQQPIPLNLPTGSLVH